MRTKKVIVLVLILAIIASTFLFVGCNNDDKIKVVIWHNNAPQQDVVMDEIIAQFNAMHDDIEVVSESQPSANFLNNVYLAVANGVGPDIIFNFASTVSDYLADRKVVNLSEYFDLNELQSVVSQTVYDECTSFGDGQLYCLPLHSSGPVLFYDVDLYNELNLSVPTTWEELSANAKVIYEKKGIAGFAADSLTDLMQCLILQNGSGYIDTENKEILFNNEITAEWLEWFGENVRSGYFTTEKDGDYFYNNFNAGLLGSFIGSCGCEEYVQDKNYGVAAIPQGGTVEWNPTWNRTLIVFSSYKEKEAAAVEFLKFFTNADNSAKWSIASGNISPYSYTAEIPEYIEFLGLNKALAVVNASKAHSTMLPTIPGSATVRTELERMAVLAISQERPIKDILDEIEETCNNLLKQG